MRYGNRALVFYLSGAVLLLALALILTRLPFGSTHTSGPEEHAAHTAAEAGVLSEEEDEVPQDPRGLTIENGSPVYYLDDGTLFTGGYLPVETDGEVSYYWFGADGKAFTGGYLSGRVDGVTRYFYFQEDGTAYTGGYKAFSLDGKRVYFYFQEDGTAFTGGYKAFSQGGKQYYFYFQKDGTAFTGGYKEITLDGKKCYFYFLANGQGYNTGYKTVMRDGKKYYYFFGSDGRAVTDGIRSVSLGSRTAYFLLQKDGSAFTGGYRSVPSGNGNDCYYFLSNGQAFTTGYKTVSLDGKTRYFFFQKNGKAFTGGLKSVSFGSLSYYYYFQSSGQALTSGFRTVNGTDYYFTENGRAARDTFTAVDGSPAYFDSSYARVSGGWFRVGDGYYYADEKGVLLTDTVKEGYRLDASGKCPTKYRILQYVDEIVSPSMTDQQKIDAIYDWILHSRLMYLRTYEHVSSSWVWEDGWTDDMAASLMDKQGGNCYRYASFFGFLVHEATGLPVTVYHGMTPGMSVDRTYHGWTVVKQDGVWYSYDPELQKFSRFSEFLCRKRPYSQSYGTLYFDGVGANLF